MDYDVTPITAHSNTDYASYKAFYRFNLFVRQPYTLLIYLAMPVIMAAIMLHVEFGLTMTTIYCVVVYALLAYSIVRNMKRNYRQWTRLRPNGVDYIFYDKEIKSIAPGGSSSYSSSFSYGLFKMVYETESAFYLYMTNQQAAVVEKGGISGGTPQELEELLKSRVGIEKYRKMKSSSRPASASASPSYVVEQERAAQNRAQHNKDEISPPSYVVEEQRRAQNAVPYAPQGSDPFAHCDISPIIVHSGCDLASFRRFQLFHMLGRRWLYPVLLVILLFTIAVQFISFEGEDLLSLLPVSILLVLIFLPVFSVFFGSRKAHKDQGRLYPCGVNFMFRSDAFETINSGSESVSSTSRTAYTLLDKVYETKTMFYLYQMSGRAYLVEKRGVADGRVMELAALLESRVGSPKYRKRSAF